MTRTHVILTAAVGLALIALVVHVPSFNGTAGAPTPPPAPGPVAAPPPPPSPPIPVVVTPQGPGSLRLDGKLSHPYVLPGANDVYLALEVSAVDVPGAARAPVNLALVIDRSGSMAGEKIVRAREAALALLGRLGPHDRLAIVHYGNDVGVYPGDFVTETNRARMARFIRGISEEGGTNIGEGLTAGRAQLLKAKSDFTVNRLVLVSDGQPTVGLTSHQGLVRLVGQLREQGLSVTALGVGTDFNEDLMARLAEVGGGSYGYVERSEAMADLFSKDLDQAATVVARGVRLSFDLPEGVTFGEVLGRFGEVNGRRVTVALPDFSARQVEKLVVRVRATASGAQVAEHVGQAWVVRNDAPAAGTTLPVAQLTLDYDDVLAAKRGQSALALSAVVSTDAKVVAQRKDPEAVMQATRARSAQNFKKAADLIEGGDTLGAQAALKDNDALFDEAEQTVGGGRLANERVQNSQAYGLSTSAPSMPAPKRAAEMKALKRESLKGSGWGASVY